MAEISVERIDAAGRVVSPSEARRFLAEGEALHRDFRPNLGPDYAGYMDRMGAEGAEILQLADEGEVRAIAVWRTFLTTYCGRRFEVDDLVTSATQRSKGYGETMLRHLEAKARALKCDALMLSSGTQRVDAHRFYFRNRLGIVAFHFSKPLTGD
ncbi:MAG: GNAT family N-acetyltransferase [Terricaulis sp.]